MGRCAMRTQQLAEATQERSLCLVGTQVGRGGRCKGGGARNRGKQAAAGQLRRQAGGPVGQLLAGAHDGGEVCRVSGVTEGNARKVRGPRAVALCQERVPGAAETLAWRSLCSQAEACSELSDQSLSSRHYLYICK